MRDVVVTNIYQERYHALILQIPAKPLPTCDKVVVGYVVPLRTLHIVKISSTTGEWRIARYGRGCVWKIYDSSDHYRGMNSWKPGLLRRSCERWENNFRVFRALITESQSYFERSERVKRFIVVTVPLAPGVGSPNFAERELLCGLDFAVLSHIKELDLSSTERRIQREKNNF